MCSSGAYPAPRVSKPCVHTRLRELARTHTHIFQATCCLPWLLHPGSGRREVLFHTTAPPPALPFLCSDGRSVAASSNKRNRSVSSGQGSIDVGQVKPSRRKVCVKLKRTRPAGRGRQDSRGPRAPPNTPPSPLVTRGTNAFV